MALNTLTLSASVIAITAAIGSTPVSIIGTTAAAAAKVMRGGATGTDAINAINATGAQYSFLKRQDTTFTHDIAIGDMIEVAVGYRVITATTAPIREMDLPTACNFQCVMEYPWTEAITGLPTNTRYQMPSPDDAAGGNTIAYVPGQMSRTYGVFKFPSPVAIPKGQKVGFWVLHEWADSTYFNLVYTQGAYGSTQLLQRNHGYSKSSTSLIASNALMTKTSVTALSTGDQMPMGPAVIRTPHGSSELAVVIMGNSEEQSNGQLEGTGSTDITGGYGDTLGNAQSMRGYAMRTWQKLGASVTQLSKGSDSNLYRLQPKFDATISVSNGVVTMTVTKMYQGGLWVGDTVAGIGKITSADSNHGVGTYTLDGGAANATGQTYTVPDPCKMRRDLAAYANPTHYHDLNDTNEISKSQISSAAAWAASKAYLRYDAVTLNGYLYICTVGGMSGSSGPGGTGAAITDGTATWCCVGPDDLGGTGGQAGAGIIANNLRFLDTIRAVLPSIKFVGATTCPAVTSIQHTSTTYTYDATGGTMTVTLSDVSDLFVGNVVAVSGLTPTSFNVGNSSSGRRLITAVDRTNKSVTYNEAAGKATPTGTISIDPGYTTQADQTPTALYVAGTSRRSWLNRYKRQTVAGTAGFNNICGFVAVADWGRYTELGEPTTPAAETGVWRNFSDGGSAIGFAATCEGGHGVARMSEYAATKIAADLVALVTA